jgi:hypothetical protein
MRSDLPQVKVDSLGEFGDIRSGLLRVMNSIFDNLKLTNVVVGRATGIHHATIGGGEDLTRFRLSSTLSAPKSGGDGSRRHSPTLGQLVACRNAGHSFLDSARYGADKQIYPILLKSLS